MRIYINIDSREVTTVPATLKFKGASVALLEIVFRNSSNEVVQLPDGVLPSLGLTSDGTLLAFIQDLEIGAGNVYSGDLTCSGATLIALLSAKSPQQISAEVLWMIGEQTFRSYTFSVSVERPEIPNSIESMPDPILYPPASDILRRSLGLSDLPNKSVAFNAIKQAATAADSGVVQLASLSDVTVGANPLKVVSAAVLAQALENLPSGSISTPKILYVSTNGNDATAEVGNPAKSYATTQAAFNAALAIAGNCVLVLGVGNWTVDVTTQDWPGRINIAGIGWRMTGLTVNLAGGANGSDGSEQSGPNGPTGGTSARSASITDAGFWSVNLQVNSSSGGWGGYWSDGEGNSSYAGGGWGSSVTLTDCWLPGFWTAPSTHNPNDQWYDALGCPSNAIIQNCFINGGLGVDDSINSYFGNIECRNCRYVGTPWLVFGINENGNIQANEVLTPSL